MLKNINELNQLFDSGAASGQTPAHVQHVREMKSVVDLRDETAKKAAKKRKSQPTTFMAFAGLMAAGAAAALFSLLGLSDVGIVILGKVIGVLSLFIGGAYALNAVNDKPLLKVKDRLDKAHLRILHNMKRNEAYRVRKMRKHDKVVAGVASAMAEKLDADPGLIRAGFVIATLVTGGSFIPVYFIAAFLMYLFRKD